MSQHPACIYLLLIEKGWGKRDLLIKFQNEISFKVFLVRKIMHSHGKKNSKNTEKS